MENQKKKLGRGAEWSAISEDGRRTIILCWDGYGGLDRGYELVVWGTVEEDRPTSRPTVAFRDGTGWLNIQGARVRFLTDPTDGCHIEASRDAQGHLSAQLVHLERAANAGTARRALEGYFRLRKLLRAAEG